MNKYRLTLLSLCMVTLAQAKVTLPSFFTDNMVIQQNSTLPIIGKAKVNKQVTVVASWDKQKQTVKAGADGSFRIDIPTPTAGGPHTLTLSDGEKLIVKNILSGEVWFCSGQSNMEMPVAGWGKVMNYEQEIANANYPGIRLLQVKKNTSHAPLESAEMNMGGWQECSPKYVPEFSSVAYFYARRLHKELNVPVGVIDCTWGGTVAEAWTSYHTLKNVMGFQEITEKMQSLGFDKEKIATDYRERLSGWQKLFTSQDRGMSNGTPQWISSAQTGSEWKSMEAPGYWETKGLTVDGVIWFQKVIDIPAEWAGKAVALSLGAIDDDETTYFNGKEIGKTVGCNAPRNYTLPAELVKAGKGIITVRVFDSGGDGGFHGNATTLFAEAGGKKISLAGSWNYRIGLTMNELPSPPMSPEGPNYPTVLYNAMVNPLINFPIKGVIWYQGESNASRAKQYASLFPAMIVDWRQKWNLELPFYFVQLANFMKPVEVQPESQWAELREAQANTLHLEHTGMAPTIEIGDAQDIHPKNKQEVAERLAALSLTNTYKKGSCITPTLQNYRISGRQLILQFDHEIRVKGTEAKSFILAGPDRIFHPAKATVRGKEIVLESAQVEIPFAARYGWADNPVCNLYSSTGFPVAPFRTDPN